jgi:hypothetical protein
MNPAQIRPAAVVAIHELYCRFTGQKLSLRFDRERLWYEYLRAGFTVEDLRRVIAWLQKEIRHQRRNIGALKLSNLLQLDRFEEDLNISRARLSLPPPQPPPSATPAPAPADDDQRTEMAARLRAFQNQLRKGSSAI